MRIDTDTQKMLSLTYSTSSFQRSIALIDNIQKTVLVLVIRYIDQLPLSRILSRLEGSNICTHILFLDSPR